jgi:hypothetical protein
LAIEGAKFNVKANAIAPIAGTRMTEEIFGPELSKLLDPVHVSPVVTFLAHEDCPVSGHVYSVGNGRVARVVIGLGEGYCKPGGLTPEEVRDHFTEIDSTDGLIIPASAFDEVKMLAQKLKG